MSKPIRPIAAHNECPPIPSRMFDWCAWFDDVGADESEYGYGRTEEEAIADLLEAADACPQCHGPVHESGFCPSCKKATV